MTNKLKKYIFCIYKSNTVVILSYYINGGIQ
nr:MAG TPA_asm: hypothetical protein [Caudoviricetes sp.]